MDKKKKWIVLFTVILLIGIVITISCISYSSKQSALRFEIIYAYWLPYEYDYSSLDAVGFFHLFTRTGQYALWPKIYPDTWLFDLKEDGTLYIMRGLHRLDNDFSQKIMMLFLNRCYVRKLDQTQYNHVIELAKSIHDNPALFGQDTYPWSGTYSEFGQGNIFDRNYMLDLDSYLWFKNDLIYYPYQPFAFDQAEMNDMIELQILLTQEFSPVEPFFQTWF